MERLSMRALRGARLLSDVEETNLEEVWSDYLPGRIQKLNAKPKHPKFLPIPTLNALAAKNFRATRSIPLAVTGRQLPLIYRVVSGLVSAPHRKTLLVIDTEHRFDVTRLSCSVEDIRHVYVHRPAFRGMPTADGDHRAATRRLTPDQIRALVAASEKWIYYGAHNSGGRTWWGTIVIGALGGGDITAAWKGWLHVELSSIPGFFIGCTIQEALADRQRRQNDVDAAPWVASSQWGDLAFTESHSAAAEARRPLTRRRRASVL
ncbi:hypothetical protein CMUS01_10139 [Colletotrichum musicola]|uniref:Uncharacterized protein n=1 Tax=Colletotrichum musicola TaxID=2175873 RepID=A0A8H6K4N0_9PEZI|nr:hypothetical protein CMUS01_10139 [Colletotrichum musicola]